MIAGWREPIAILKRLTAIRLALPCASIHTFHIHTSNTHASHSLARPKAFIRRSHSLLARSPSLQFANCLHGRKRLATTAAGTGCGMTGKANVKPFVHEVSSTVCYVVSDPESRAAAIIDIVLDVSNNLLP